ncbi:hypothetical protein KM043_000468 [Ampulex compressa]|nr:hypothetical protein KM043_000468 [Ampulex compressa]
MLEIDHGPANREPGKDTRVSAEEMDEQRHRTLAYEYLCHLEEAKKWMEACLEETLPPTTELEENLRNGVYLAKLARFMAPDELPYNRIYDPEQRRYAVAGLQFRHTDNINHFLRSLKSMQLPLTFQPETTDVYDKKNMPRLIYCIHALSTHLFKLGMAPQIQDLYGKVDFTDEEIDAVSKELQKYGIQMPSFQKIGGLLTNSMAVDAAALHAAVIAVNQAIVDKSQDRLLATLQIKVAQLKNVIAEYTEDYADALFEAKEIKTQAALNRSLNDSYVSDAYDELLTQAEIQGHVNQINVRCTMEKLARCIREDGPDLMSILRISWLDLQRVLDANERAYRKELEQVVQGFERSGVRSKIDHSWRSLVQEAIDKGNDVVRKLGKREEYTKLLNASLEAGAREDFSEVLRHPDFGLVDRVDDVAIPLYYEEMRIDRAESGNDLSYGDVLVSLRVLSSIAAVTKAVDTGHPELVYDALKNPDTHFSGLDEDNKVKYFRALAEARHEKRSASKECPLLTYIDVQECIDFVNEQWHRDKEVIRVLHRLNTAVLEKDRAGLTAALRDTSLSLERSTSPEDATLYLKLFDKCLAEKREDGSELWLEDVESVGRLVAAEAAEVRAACALLARINAGLEADDAPFTMEALRASGFEAPSEEDEARWFRDLRLLREKKAERYTCRLVRHVTSMGNESYLDLEKYSYTWDRPKSVSETCRIDMRDIKEITGTGHSEDRPRLDPSSGQTCLEMLVRLQARIRGYSCRRSISEKFSQHRRNVAKVVAIQAWWRGTLQRRRHAAMLRERGAGSKPAGRKASRAEERAEEGLEKYRKYEDEIRRIQAAWRGRRARRAFHSLLHMEKPPFNVVRHFSSVLNLTTEDYEKDLQLQHLKHEVVQCIRHNQNLSQQLDGMDIKIGLLIQNRITLEDVVAHGKSLERLAKQGSAGVGKEQKGSAPEGGGAAGGCKGQKGLRSLTKEGRRMLEGYQHLFYALQTNPAYLSKLLFLLPQSKTNKFLQNVILTLFNFGSNIREEYLLLKLFGSALREEIRCKFEKPSEVVTGNPLVLKMVVNYARQLNGQRALREIVGPLIEKILSDRRLSIETNPVDIYKCWRNQLEMETGETLDLPYTVTQEQALNYEQVRRRLRKGMQLLQGTVLEFLKRITESRDEIPYGMLYMAKVLRDSLTEKFPSAPEKDILKVVGNLIYYHFINAAIVAPDAFDIVSLPVDRSLSNDQRRNLASIAKILQFAASKKGFGEEATHLVCLNPFIIECHERFKSFFRYCCQVEELEEHFCIHEYTEATLIEKPEIYISLQEICDTHCLMLEYQDQIAPDPMDSLHDLLEDLGRAPSVATLLGIPDAAPLEPSLSRHGKTEVCLVLTNKFQVPEDADTNFDKLFIKTKELLVFAFPFLTRGQSLVEALESGQSPGHGIEIGYEGNRLALSSPTSSAEHRGSSLADCKARLRAYLNKLELGGWVSREDGYQNIVTAVAKDLCNKGKYRALRNRELQTLRLAKQRLEEKSKYYEEQVNYYSEYIQRCLENLHAGKGSLRAFKAIQRNHHGKLRSKMTLRYTAAKLQEKGVLLEVDGLPHSQFKNVAFEISPTEQSGLFNVRCRFMGVEMEKVDIDIQRLLELQFEGAPIMDMFGKAKINVNLLLYLLNRKFYGKG